MQVWSLGWEDLVEEGMTTTSVFLPGEPHGLSLEGYRGLSPQDHKELDTTATTQHIPGHIRLVLPHSKGGAGVVPELGIH